MAKTDEYSIKAILKALGWKTILLSVDFILSIVVAIIIVAVSFYGTAFTDNSSEIITSLLAVSSALLGLIIAAYAIFASFGNDGYLAILVKSGIYDEVVGSFALSSMALVAAIITGATTLVFIGFIDVIARIGYIATIFLSIYGVLLVASISISSLRIVALLRRDYVMGATKK